MDQISNAMGLILMIWIVGAAAFGISSLTAAGTANGNFLRGMDDRKRVPGEAGPHPNPAAPT
jgi:hypothetical protein